MISSAELAKKQFDGIVLPDPYGSLLGKIPTNATGVIWGPKGSGKSTMAVAFAYVLANELGKGIYCSSEEGPGPSMQNKIKRLKADHDQLMVTDYDGLGDLKAAIQYSSSKFCILDSASMSYVKISEFEEFHDWCKSRGVILFYILHANKEGWYKGNTLFVHMPDIEIKVADGIAKTEKNRFEETPREMEVSFNADSRESRENPVDVPFTITLKEIVELHSIRSWKRLNSMLGDKMPCYTKRHSGEKENADLSLRYYPDYTNKKYILELRIDGHVEYESCTEGESGNFKASLEELAKEYGDLEVVIYKQDHAKLVLGAKEYKRQEKERKKKMEAKEKRAESEKDSGIEDDSPKIPKESKVAKQQKEGAKKESEPEPKYEYGDLLYLADDVDRHDAGTQVKVRSDYYPEYDDTVKVRCCEGEMIKEVFKVPDSKLSKTKSAEKKETNTKKSSSSSGIDKEAARKSQQKLDEFLDEILAS